MAGSIDYGSGASGLFAIALGLIAQQRDASAGASVAANLAHFAQLIQSDRIVTGASLRSNAEPVADAQVGVPCPPEFSATSVMRQNQHDGSSDHHPAPTHVRFDEANDPIIISAAVLDGSDPDS